MGVLEMPDKKPLKLIYTFQTSQPIHASVAGEEPGKIDLEVTINKKAGDSLKLHRVSIWIPTGPGTAELCSAGLPVPIPSTVTLPDVPHEGTDPESSGTATEQSGTTTQPSETPASAGTDPQSSGTGTE